MEKQKRFKKQELNSEDYKGMERGAKLVKRGLGVAGSVFLAVKNWDKLKAFGKGVTNFATKIIKR